MHYCLVNCRVSSTCHIYKFDRSMTRGKLLDNDTQLFIFISILIMTQLHQRNPENRQQNRFSERFFSEKKKKQLQPVEWESVAWLTASLDLSGNNAEFVSVDLIWEQNQVILEYGIKNWKELPRYIKECKRKDVFVNFSKTTSAG